MNLWLPSRMNSRLRRGHVEPDLATTALPSHTHPLTVGLAGFVL